MPHDILLQQKMVEEPWKPFGVEKCFWVSENDWVYSLDFSVTNLSGEKRLIFKELKGKADVSLNRNKVASHADQSHPLVVDITGQLKSKNQLVLHFSKAAPDAKPDGKDILLPGEKKVVRILGKHTNGFIIAKPWYSPNSTSFNWQRT